MTARNHKLKRAITVLAVLANVTIIGWCVNRIGDLDFAVRWAEDKTDRLERMIEELRGDLNDDNSLASMQDEIERLRYQLRSLSSEVEDHESKLRKLEDELEDLDSDVTSLRLELSWR